VVTKFVHQQPPRAKHREVELEKPGALERAQQGEFSLAGLIRWYIDSFCELSKWRRTKQTSLEFLKRHTTGEVNALRLTTAMLIDHVRARRAAEPSERGTC